MHAALNDLQSYQVMDRESPTYRVGSARVRIIYVCQKKLSGKYFVVERNVLGGTSFSPALEPPRHLCETCKVFSTQFFLADSYEGRLTRGALNCIFTIACYKFIIAMARQAIVTRDSPLILPRLKSTAARQNSENHYFCDLRWEFCALCLLLLDLVWSFLRWWCLRVWRPVLRSETVVRVVF